MPVSTGAAGVATAQRTRWKRGTVRVDVTAEAQIWCTASQSVPVCGRSGCKRRAGRWRPAHSGRLDRARRDISACADCCCRVAPRIRRSRSGSVRGTARRAGGCAGCWPCESLRHLQPRFGNTGKRAGSTGNPSSASNTRLMSAALMQPFGSQGSFVTMAIMHAEPVLSTTCRGAFRLLATDLSTALNCPLSFKQFRSRAAFFHGYTH